MSNNSMNTNPFYEKFAKLLDSLDPKNIAMKEFKLVVKRKEKITPAEFRKHGLVKTADLLEESNRLFNMAYLEAQKELELWC